MEKRLRPSACFEIEKIIGIASDECNGGTNFQVQWAPSWISGSYLVGCDDLIKEFLHDTKSTDDTIALNEMSMSAVISSGENSTDTVIVNENSIDTDTTPNRNSTDIVMLLNENSVDDTIFTKDSLNDERRVSLSDEIKTDIMSEGKEGETLDYLQDPVSMVFRGKDRISMPNERIKSECRNVYILSTSDDYFDSSRTVDDEECDKSRNFTWNQKVDINHPLHVNTNVVQHNRNIDKIIDKNSEELALNLHNTSSENKFSRKEDSKCVDKILGNTLKRIEKMASKVKRTTKTNSENTTYDLSTDHKGHLSNNIKDNRTSPQLSNGSQVAKPSGDYRCHICGRTFQHKGNIKRHLRIHVGDAPFKCHVCGKTCNQNHDLVRHMRVHTGEKPFQCVVCSKSFTRKTTLRKHMVVHEGDMGDVT